MSTENEIEKEANISSNVQNTEEIVKEINVASSDQTQLSCEEDNQNNNENDSVNKPNNKSIKIVEKKPISKLTDEDRALIMKNYSEGIDQPYFEVKQFKNGNYKIIKKKPTKPTISEKEMEAIVCVCVCEL